MLYQIYGVEYADFLEGINGILLENDITAIEFI